MYAGVLNVVIAGKVVSLDPELVAEMFDRDPLEFSNINHNVDILLGTTKISIVPV